MHFHKPVLTQDHCFEMDVIRSHCALQYQPSDVTTVNFWFGE